LLCFSCASISWLMLHYLLLLNIVDRVHSFFFFIAIVCQEVYVLFSAQN